MSEAYIVAATRTAGGRKGGQLSGWHPADLAAQVIDELLRRTGADPARVDDVIMGCVSQIGEQSTNIARNAVLASSLPETVPATSVDRQCGSSQQAIHFAAQAVMSGTMDMVIASGVESMSRVPIGTPMDLPQKAGLGFYKSPAMEARYPDVFFSQFTGAEEIARKWELGREEMEQFSLESHQKSRAATEAGRFDAEIVAVKKRLHDGTVPGDSATKDEGIRYDASLEAMSQVRLLTEGGRLTAASASQICDGAAGVMVVNERGLKALGVEPLARIHHLSVTGGDPVVMLETPIAATARALKLAGIKIDEIDLFEVNEAFASVPMAWVKGTGADPDRLNINGGAISLGHPLGGSGAKLMTTLVHALKDRGKRYGLQTMCEGGGLANVTIVERL
ncbi:MAG: acetyl-CoA C-acetyltransferase [Aestuariivita sp.]|uniref:acetyl-CoA C-acetyltransferase n=1 Tax=Aestuariivita sp. TaxID=1872407 RepID=UPI003BB020DE